MNNEILFFIIAFILPHIFYRTILFTKEKFFDKPILREKTGLKIHHMHYGMIVLLIAITFLLFIEKNIYITTAMGLGMGLMFDEFIPALLMKSKRKDEMIVYKKSFLPTLIMFAILIMLLVLLTISL